MALQGSTTRSRYADATLQTLLSSNNVQSLWRQDIRPEYHRYDEVMGVRFHTRKSIIAHEIRQLRQGVMPDEEDLRTLQNDQAEDERLTRLALSSDQEAVENAMKVKEAQMDVHVAEEDLRKARAAAAKAVKREDAYTARVQEQARKEAISMTCLNRMLGPAFPSEMLMAVLEAAIRSERLRWRATEPESLKAAVDAFFAWPSALNANMRTHLQGVAGRALLKKALIELPADFTLSNGTTELNLPPAIAGNEKHIRHLVLEIKLNPRNPACQVQLNMACRGIAPLSSRLPQLEVFVVSLFLERNDSEFRAESFDPKKLALRNQKGWKITDVEDLKTTLVRFFDVLHAKGPGRHKFVRFVDRKKDGFAHTGPLVKVPEFVAPKSEDGSSQVDASNSPTDPSVAEQVLEQAYRYHRDMAPVGPAKDETPDDLRALIESVGNSRPELKGGRFVSYWEPEYSEEE